MVIGGSTGNYRSIFVSAAIVPNENYHFCSWFLTEVSKSELKINLLMSDGDKGNKKAIVDVLPNTKFLRCYQHKRENFKNKITKDHTKIDLLNKIQSTNTIKEFDRLWSMLSIEEKKYLESNELLNTWSTAHQISSNFKLGGYCSNNQSEIINNVLVPTRKKNNISDMACGIYSKMVNSISSTISDVKSWKNNASFTPVADKLIKEELSMSNLYFVEDAITSSNSINIIMTRNSKSRVVDIKNYNTLCCSTRDIACRHKIAAATYYNSVIRPEKKITLFDLTSPVYIISNYNFLKQLHLPSLPDINNYVGNCDIKLPLLTPKRGRKKRNSRINTNTNSNQNNKLPRKNKCKNCGQSGHQSKTCKNVGNFIANTTL